jgi:hypothetical protein
VKLPAHPLGGVQIGISDLLQWRDCPERMQFGMRRHEETGEAPESWAPGNAYGSAIHYCLEKLDDGASEQDASQGAMEIWSQWLEPSDLDMLYDDMEKYQAREELGVRTLLNEGEVSVRLFVHPVVGQVWFRAKIDRLYQSLADPAALVHVDFKSSKHAKSEDEVHKDTQIWAYHWIIVKWFEYTYPEHGAPALQQIYDQLRYGQIGTSKSPDQLASIERWLTQVATALIEDEEMAPKFNEWCPWCLPAGSKVCTGEGVREIQDLREGDMVVTHEGRLRPIAAIAQRTHNGDIVRFRTILSPFAQATPEHLFLATRKSSLTSREGISRAGDDWFSLKGTGKGTPVQHSWNSVTREWLPACELAIGDILWTRIEYGDGGGAKLSLDEKRLLGWYLAEGHVTDRSVGFSLHSNEVTYAEEIEKLLRDEFNLSHIDVQRRSERHTTQIYAHSRTIAAWFEFMGGKGCVNKVIHPSVMRDDDLMPLVVAAWKGDGTKPRGATQMPYTTTSSRLAEQVMAIFIREGFSPSLGISNKKNRLTAYTIVLNGHEAAHFARMAGCADGLRPVKYEHARSSVISEDGWLGAAVREVCTVSFVGDVYDLEVKDDASFMLPGFIAAHNCPLKMDCVVVREQLTDWAQNRIAAMSVREPKIKKDGTPSKVLAPPSLADPQRLAEYVENMDSIHRAEQVLKAFEELLRDTLKQMPSDDLATLGKRKVERSVRAFSTSAKRQMIDEVGLDTFLHMADVSIAAVERFYGDDKEAAGALTQFAEKRPGYTVIVDL